VSQEVLSLGSGLIFLVVSVMWPRNAEGSSTYTVFDLKVDR